jgi:hypothetical protein
MELFIRIKDGKAFEHPIFGDNFRAAFPDVDTNNLPPDFAKFVRVEPPRLGPYEKNQTVSYVLVNDVYTDSFSCEQMTAEEITAKQNKVLAYWAQHGFPSWTFDAPSCTFVPPTPCPTDGKSYDWDEPTLSWIEMA